MKYKVGDKVRVKSLDWYNENKDENGIVLVENGDYMFCKSDIEWCGRIITIKEICLNEYYKITEDFGKYRWTDEMIEGLVEEETYDFLKTDKPYPSPEDRLDNIQFVIDNELKLPEGYIFKDENGNIINATKIVLEKKKKEYPKTFKECQDYLGEDVAPMVEPISKTHRRRLVHLLEVLLACRDAYWKIAGEEMGLGKPWEPEYPFNTARYAITNSKGFAGKILAYDAVRNFILEFPTEEMRDAFNENFKELIEQCKELL